MYSGSSWDVYTRREDEVELLLPSETREYVGCGAQRGGAEVMSCRIHAGFMQGPLHDLNLVHSSINQPFIHYDGPTP